MDTLSYAVPASAIRVFTGFRNPALDRQQFITGLGSTFMPGTPYMLQPLGLAAYLPALIDEQSGSPCPHEVALIAWPSQDIQRIATQQTLRGRVYTQSHGGLYAQARSVFPQAANQYDPQTAGALYLHDGVTDWQNGAYTVYVAAKKDAALDGASFRRTLCDAIVKTAKGTDVDQCIASLADDWVVIWTHMAKPFTQLPDLWASLSALVTPSAHILGLRVICRDEPPSISLSGSQAMNFVFLRHAAAFLS